MRKHLRTAAAVALLALTATAAHAADPFWLYLARSLFNNWDGFTL